MPFLKSVVTQLADYKSGKFFRDEFRGDSSWNGRENNNLLRNEGLDESGTPMFADVAKATGADNQADGRGLSLVDFDNDGDLDIVIATNPGDHGEPVRPVLLRNDLGHTRNRVVIELEGTKSNRDAIGASVIVRCSKGKGADTQEMMRHVSGGTGYASQSTNRLHFGMADYDVIDELTVRWPSGASHVFKSVKANQRLNISEDGTLAASPFLELADGERVASKE